jgi:hypothetical protein
MDCAEKYEVPQGNGVDMSYEEEDTWHMRGGYMSDEVPLGNGVSY